LKLRDIADRLGCRLDGDGAVEIARVAGIKQAERGDLTFVASAKYADHLASTRASAAIVGTHAAYSAPAGCALLRTDDPYTAFAHALTLFVPAEAPAKGVDRLTAIAADARIGPDVAIGPFVTVGARAAIGARTVVYPGVVIGPGAEIGEDCIIHPQVSIRDRV